MARLDQIFRRWSWLLIGGEHLRKSFGNLRKIFGKGRQGFGKGGQGKAEKKQGGVGGGRPEKKREGWVSDDVIKKIKKIKKKNKKKKNEKMKK